MLDVVTTFFGAKLRRYGLLALGAVFLAIMASQWVMIASARADVAVAQQEVAKMRATLAEKEAEWARDVAAAETKRAKAEKDRADAERLAREREHQMAEAAATIERTKNARIASLEQSLGIALHSLRHHAAERAAGPSGVPAPTEAGAGCTGAGLARPDAEFLVRYAARAHRLQLEYAACREGRSLSEGGSDAQP